MWSRFWPVALAIAVCALGAVAWGEEQQHPPNVVLILIDDLGWADLPAYGNRFHETPNIDRLCREGMRFTDFYAAAPVCSPTRATIQSGQYTPRTGITNFIPGHWRPFERLVEPPIPMQMDLSVVTIAEALKESGYVTGHFGKWHLGGSGFLPGDQGYDVAYTTAGAHFGFRVVDHPELKIPRDVYLADFLTDHAVEFIRANKDRPFFVHLAHFAVHIPLQAKPDTIRKYELKPRPDTGVNNPTYAAMIEHVDESVGRVLAVLDELGLAGHTLVIFTSDNGGLYRRFDGKGETVTTNEPLRGEKGSLYEGGIRVPLIMRWPGVIPANSVCHVPTISVDLYPTILEAAGASPPAGQVLDGVSLMRVVKGGTIPERSLYFHYPHYHHSRPAGAIRRGNWKLIEFFDTGECELYNLEDDIGETRNLAAAKPELVNELRKQLQQWRKRVGAKMPSPNPNYDPNRAHEWWSRMTKKPLG